MKNYNYNRTTNYRFSIKGKLEDDGKTITYVNGDKEEAKITIDKCLSPFKGEDISLSISSKEDADMSDEIEEEE